MDGTFAQPTLETRPAVHDPPGAGRNADTMLGAAVVAMGLFAGLFYTFTTAVMPGLTAADDRSREPSPAARASLAVGPPRSPAGRRGE